ncbi:MAG: hypothetical protein HRU19_29395 [Pseudobacteriovorax sp.]|nr:hypothetical protein [Pseudobacteriovorax sp.]
MNLIIAAVDSNGWISVFPNNDNLSKERKSLAAVIEMLGDRKNYSYEFKNQIMGRGTLNTLGDISNFCEKVNNLTHSQYLAFQTLILDGILGLEESLRLAAVMKHFTSSYVLTKFVMDEMPKTDEFYNELLRNENGQIKFMKLCERFPLKICTGVHGTYADVDTILAEFN